MVSPAATYAGGKIAFDTQGSGSPTLIFIHGWSCDRTYWTGAFNALAKHSGVVALDLGGHGASSSDRRSWTIESFGEDVEAVAEYLNLGRVVLIGHSMGGDVAVAAARRLARRVAGIVWVDTYKRLGTVRTAEQLRQILEPLDGDFAGVTRARVRDMFAPGCDSELVERVAANIAAAAPDVARAAMASSLAYAGEVPGALRELNVPVVAINAMDAPTDIDALKRHGVDVVLMPGVGHFPMLERPEAFNGILASVVARFR